MTHAASFVHRQRTGVAHHVVADVPTPVRPLAAGSSVRTCRCGWPIVAAMPTSEFRTPQIVNLTPHTVTVRCGGRDVEFESEGIARIEDAVEAAVDLNGTPVCLVGRGGVTGLPQPSDGQVFLVSRVLAAALPSRRDLVFPFREIRDLEGRIVAVESLGTFASTPAWLDGRRGFEARIDDGG